MLIDQLIDATGGEWPSNDFRCRVQKTLITRAEFEARKAERQNKPDWGKAPAWANWLMQDGSGFWLWFELRPSKYWVVEGGKYLEVNDGEVIGDWRNTLEQRPNHIGESDEKVSTYAEIQQAAQACERALNEFFPKVKLGESDWYDYNKQEAIEKPPIGAECIVLGNVHARIIGATASGYLIYQSVKTGFCEMALLVSSFRPLDWNRNLQPNPEPESSPELRFHLSNAFNELQASARLLPEDDPRRAQIVALASGISALREVA